MTESQIIDIAYTKAMIEHFRYLVDALIASKQTGETREQTMAAWSVGTAIIREARELAKQSVRQ